MGGSGGTFHGANRSPEKIIERLESEAVVSASQFETTLAENGSLYIDSSLIERKTAREDVTAHYIPATKLASENGMEGLANMIMLGAVIRESGVCSREIIGEAMKKVISERKKDMFEKNIKAIETGLSLKQK